MKCWVLSVVGLIYGLYVIIGGLIFWAVEKDNEQDTITNTGRFRTAWLNNHSCVTSEEFDALVNTIISAYDQGVTAVNTTVETTPTWTAHTSIYFAVTVVTTIGYGNISPATQGGRIFCVFFAIIGIPLCLVFLAQIGVKINKMVMKFDDFLAKKMTCGSCEKHPKGSKICRLLIIQSVLVTLLMFIPALIFTNMETGWTYADGLYYSFVTMTTIGFGDYVAGFNDVWGHPLYRLMIACWIVLGLAWMSSIIAMVQETYDETLNKVDKKAKEKVKPKDENEMEKNDSVNEKSAVVKL